MIRVGEKIRINHKAKEFSFLEVSYDVVVIQFTDGNSYEVHRDGSIYDCNYRKSGQKVLIKQSNSRGYKQISVRANGESVVMRTHRLIAMCFVPNPNNLPQVNHKDENTLNNNADNLEWCDAKYNVIYSLTRNPHRRNYHKGVKLSKLNIINLLPGQTLSIQCSNAAELDSVSQVAYSARRDIGVETLKISRSAKTMTVTITRQ